MMKDFICSFLRHVPSEAPQKFANPLTTQKVDGFIDFAANSFNAEFRNSSLSVNVTHNKRFTSYFL